MSAVIQLMDSAKAAGLAFSQGHWSLAEVYWCAEAMPAAIRQSGQANPALEYYCRQAEPHTPAHEFFFDREAKIAIAFEIDK